MDPKEVLHFLGWAVQETILASVLGIVTLSLVVFQVLVMPRKLKFGDNTMDIFSTMSDLCVVAM